MRVLIVTQYFYPENFKSNDMAFELVKRGYEVDVLVGIPNYSEGKYYKGYGLFKKRFEKIDGVRVFRAFQFPRGQNSGIRLALNYLSYAFFASIWAFFLSVFIKYCCVIVHEPSPITQGYPAVVVKKLQKIPLYFWVLDIWPDALKSGGGISNKSILSFVDRIVKYMYTNSDKILISSQGFDKMISAKGDFGNKIEYFPNWSDDLLKMDATYEIPKLPDGFIIMLAGNLGKSQNLDAVMNTALELKENKSVKWVLVGDGSMRKWVEDFVEANNLADTVFTLGRFPPEAMPSFYQAADAMLLTLKGSFPHLRHVVPARLQSYMSAGRPILAMIDGEAANMVSEANCGFSVGGGDSSALAKLVTEIIPKRNEFELLGVNGRKYYEINFQKDVCISHLCKIIEIKNPRND